MKSKALYSNKKDCISLKECPSCGREHLDIKCYDDQKYLYVKCPETNNKITLIYS